MDIKLKHLLEQDDYPGPSESGPIYCEVKNKLIVLISFFAYGTVILKSMTLSQEIVTFRSQHNFKRHFLFED